ncbi:cysteine desulfurase NifS [Desulforegula conservatrix]|uniref:cysteine desulfurase NifS n=1 Tax=Desulforegula conservatrix TaxID=153026 RepID=UPI00041BB78D|nr:cysteine desulfurase NifS [Desulforegula conservatrix]
MKPVYVDNNATTKVAPEIVEAMLPFYTEMYGNPSSMHTFGGQVASHIEKARKQVASLLGALPEEIIFTSCGTESDGAAIRSALHTQPTKNHIITTMVEHPAIKTLCETLSKHGFRITTVPVDNRGRLDMDFLTKNLTDDTAIVSVMWANNETGTIFPVEEIAELCSQKGILFHTDAVQAVGKIDMDLSKTKIDMLSLSGHKLHAPKGIGALYVRKGTKFTPFMIGGHQEKGKRAGTENVASIVALGRACDFARESMEKENTYVKMLRDKLETTLTTIIPKAVANGDLDNRLPNTSSISFEFIEGEAILLMMNELGICASSGSACTSGSLEPSHVLRAMGVPYTAAHGTIRFSLSIYNTEEEIDFIIEKLPPIIKRLRSISPYWDKSWDF